MGRRIREVTTMYSNQIISQSWIRDATKTVITTTQGQQTLSGSPKEARLHQVASAVLNTTLLQAERDDQQAIIECTFRAYQALQWKEPNYEAVRRCIQKFQNEYKIAPISAEELEKRKEKQAFVSGKWKK